MADVTHYLVTNREIYKDSSGKERIKEDGREVAKKDMRFAKVTFNSNNPDNIDYELFKDIKEKKVRFDIDSTAPKKGSQIVLESLYKKMVDVNASNQDVLVYVHGFNTNLEASLKSIPDLHKEFVLNDDSPIGNILLFTWPAESGLLEYRDDSQDALDSGEVMARLIRRLLRFYLDTFGNDPDNPHRKFCNKNIHLMCHSMGNQVLESALNFLNEKYHVPSVFEEVVLVAADVDTNAMEDTRPLSRATELGTRVTSYFNNNDRAVLASTTTKHFKSRLGFTGPHNPRITPMNAHFVDVTRTTLIQQSLMDTVVNHSYHLVDSNVISDIRKVLSGTPSSDSTMERAYSAHDNVFKLTS